MKDKFVWDFIPGMFLHPRKTMAMIVDGEHYEWVLAIAAVIGAGSMLLQANAWHAGLHFGFWPVLVGALVMGGIYGVLSLYLNSWLITVSGRWIGAKGDIDMVRAALAWGRIPMLAGYVVFLVQLIMFGDQVFASHAWSFSNDHVLREFIFLLDITIVVFDVWALVTVVSALSEVQGLTIARTVGNLFFAGMLVALPLMLIVMLLSVLRH